MRWTKIKDIIILLLLLVNGFLLGMVGLRAWQSGQNERETRVRMVAVLERNGISFLPETVPGELELTGRRVALDVPGEAEAALLVGEVTNVRPAGARVTYEGPRGTVTLSADGEVEADFAKGTVLLEENGEAGTELLSALGVEVREVDRTDDGGQTVLTYVQLWDGTIMPDQTVTLTYRDGSLEKLSLRRLAGTEEIMNTGEKTITASTALVRFLEALNEEGYVCSQVTDLYAGYTVSGTASVTLTPTWYVETDTWPWRFAVNGYTGSVAAAE